MPKYTHVNLIYTLVFLCCLFSDSLDDQYPLAMSSPNRVETSVQSSENRLVSVS